MSGLLPQKPPVNVPESEPRVLDITAEETAAVVTALSSDTARAILLELSDEPATQSELADRADISIQNVGYHLDRLVDTDLVAVVEQWRSEKGRTMDVYASADTSLVLVTGDGKPSVGTCEPPTDTQASVGELGLQSSD
jgi:DNA-binding transcriptional ArsR family regulator